MSHGPWDHMCRAVDKGEHYHQPQSLWQVWNFCGTLNYTRHEHAGKAFLRYGPTHGVFE